ncbi:MAG: HAMP domain-containing histidine kinase [Phycisphaerales bacterium]|nr:MAG: HAMP domain-containing histidine kinase [Phycisphaerales bacterium]
MHIQESPELVSKSSERAAEIVENILSFIRKSDTHLSSRDLGKLLDHTVDLAASDYDLKRNYDFRHIELIRECDPDLPHIPCEGTKIQQVIFNLLKNGAQAMAEQENPTETPRFVLRTLRDGDMARIELEDNGPGMSEETRQRAFEPFFTTKETNVGAGLGLSVSYFIITENHAGTMTVESSPGRGAKFIVRIPLRRVADAVATHSLAGRG